MPMPITTTAAAAIPMYFPRLDGGACLSTMTGGAIAPALPAASAIAADDSTIVGAPSAPSIGCGGAGFAWIGGASAFAASGGFGATSAFAASGGFGETAAASGFVGAAAGFGETRGMTIVASG